MKTEGRRAAPEPEPEDSPEPGRRFVDESTDPATPDDWDEEDSDDDLAPRRRAEGPQPPYAPARRNLRLVVGLVAIVVLVTTSVVAAGLVSNDQTAARAVPETTPTPTVTPSAQLPAEDTPEPVALQPVPSSVMGIPQPCSADFVWDDSVDQRENISRMQEQWGITLTGEEWYDASYRDGVKVLASTLDAVDCTRYLDRVKKGNGGQLTISGAPPRTSWAWGDYGLTKPYTVTLDLAKFQQGWDEGQRGRLARLIIHEFAHAVNTDRFENPPYWQRTNELFTQVGPISDYGSTPDETFADAVGYYVARCAEGNPYDQAKNQPYYDLVREELFAGTEFGGPVGEPQTC